MNKLKNATTLLLTASILTSFTSCATIVHGTHQSVGIASSPSNASVWIDRNYQGNTPIIVEMSRKDNHFIRIELEGYEAYEATFSRKMSGWVFGNIIFGGLIGLAVDAVSGGIYVLTPDQIQAELMANRMTYSKKTADSYITIVLEPDPSWKKVGSLVAIK